MIDPWTRASLRVAVYQLRHLDRVPAHAVVDEAVAIVRGKRGPKLGGFVNAVLRKVASVPRDANGPRMELPSWIAGAIGRSLGRERFEAFLGIAATTPSVDLRVFGDIDVEDVARAIAASRPDASVVRGSVASRALRLHGAGDPRTLPGYTEGRFAVQEQGAQRVVELLGARPGERIADLCAGHGTKTAVLAEAVGASGEVVAVDLHARRLEAIDVELRRLRLDANVRTKAIDLTVGIGDLSEASFDRVLVDAPCTGLGTLHRRPEILLRMTPDMIADLGRIQSKILMNAWRLVRPGGTVLYAVCSPLLAEGLDVVESLSGAVPKVASSSDSQPTDDDGIIRLGPWLGDDAASTEAYQVWVGERPEPSGNLR
jgi:16S rRNA (cytosine967-C5)-methyltransferase